MIDLAATHRAALKRHADALWNARLVDEERQLYVFKGAEGYDHTLRFTMAHYDDNPLSAPSKNCGSAGCSLGVASYTVEPRIMRRGTGRYESWDRYCLRVFGIDDLHDGDLSLDEAKEHTKAWNWLFSPFWEDIDDTPRGAAQRIYLFLASGGAPEEFDQYSVRPSDKHLYQHVTPTLLD